MPRHAGQKGQQAFTMIELLIIMIILGLLASLVAPKLIQKVGSSKVKTARTQISMLETALDAYRLDLGRYPSTEEGLKALVEKIESPGWDGPYLRKQMPLDPWGREYQYRSPGEHGPFDLFSLGSDGAQGGEGENADVVNWESNP
jgi:general secretion pathway protein G